MGDFDLVSPVAQQFATLLETNVPAAIATYNAQGGVQLTNPAQYLPRFPSDVTLTMGGLPAMAVSEGTQGTEFEDDLVSTVTAEHPLVIVAYAQVTDYDLLADQLRGYLTVIARVVNADRKLGSNSAMCQPPASLWGPCKLVGTIPGEPLAEIDPDNKDAPPKSFMSWSGLLVMCKRNETGG